jgi:hypothetical protein
MQPDIFLLLLLSDKAAFVIYFSVCFRRHPILVLLGENLTLRRIDPFHNKLFPNLDLSLTDFTNTHQT